MFPQFAGTTDVSHLSSPQTRVTGHEKNGCGNALARDHNEDLEKSLKKACDEVKGAPTEENIQSSQKALWNLSDCQNFAFARLGSQNRFVTSAARK